MHVCEHQFSEPFDEFLSPLNCEVHVHSVKVQLSTVCDLCVAVCTVSKCWSSRSGDFSCADLCLPISLPFNHPCVTMDVCTGQFTINVCTWCHQEFPGSID